MPGTYYLTEIDCAHRAKIDFIQPRMPTQNGHVEGFNGKFRNE